MRTLALLGIAVALAGTNASANVVMIQAQKDNTIFSESNALSNGAGQYLFTGTTASGFTRRALIQFDVASAIPAGSTINSVTLSLQMSMTIVGAQDVELHRALASWGEGTSDAPGSEGGGDNATANDATWSDRFYNVSQWATSGGDFAPAVSSTVSVSGNAMYTWPSTSTFVADVQSFVSSPSGNFGWLIKSANEITTPTAKRFNSRTNSIASQRPKLVVDFTPPAPLVAFCFGDGSGTACPCGNAGAAGNGCANSLNANGANLAGTGSASIANDTLALVGTGMGNSSALYFQGTTQVGAGAGAAFGDGLRCAGGSVIRLGTETNMNGASVYPTGANPPVSVRGGITTAGSVRHYQCWYRNAAAFCTAATYNLTNGLTVTWGA
jgi:hypothetical protein